jgi:hypothetical protein
VNDDKILNDKMNDNKEDRARILVYIVQNGAISTMQTAQTIGRSHSTLAGYCCNLSAKTFFGSSGVNRNKSYRLKTVFDKL